MTKNKQLYASESEDDIIRKIDLNNNTSEIVAGVSGHRDGKSSESLLRRPDGIALDFANKFLYISDSDNMCIRRLDIGQQVLETFCKLDNGVTGLCIDRHDNLYVCTHTSEILKISSSSQQLVILDLDQVTQMKIACPAAVILNPQNEDELYFSAGTKVYKIVMSTKQLSVVNDGLLFAQGMCFFNNDLLVADNSSATIHRIDLTSGSNEIFAGGGSSIENTNGECGLLDASFNGPNCIIEHDGYIYIGDDQSIQRIE